MGGKTKFKSQADHLIAVAVWPWVGYTYSLNLRCLKLTCVVRSVGCGSRNLNGMLISHANCVALGKLVSSLSPIFLFCKAEITKITASLEQMGGLGDKGAGFLLGVMKML